jgi:hypothetical protein
LVFWRGGKHTPVAGKGLAILVRRAGEASCRRGLVRASEGAEACQEGSAILGVKLFPKDGVGIGLLGQQSIVGPEQRCS